MSIDWCVIEIKTSGPAEDGTDRIVELALVAVDEFGMHLDEWHTLIQPGGGVDPSAIEANAQHDIDASMLEGAPTFKEIAGDVLRFLGDRRLVAHDARPKAELLAAAFQRIGVELDGVDVLCTTALSTRAGIGLSLAGCCSVLGIENTEPGTAIGDARATAEIFEYHLAVQHYPPGRATLFGLPAAFHSDAMIVPSERAWTRADAWLETQPRPAVEPGFHWSPPSLRDAPFPGRVPAERERGEDELDDFVRIGHRCGVNSPRCLEINYSYLRGLVALAFADGSVSEAERANLERVCAMLGMDQAVLDSLLEREQRISRFD